MADQYQDKLLAWEFDQIYPGPVPGELEWYASHAIRAAAHALGGTPGPILEYCCGSGRILVPLAERLPGVKFEGLDSSLAMLDRLEAKATYALGPNWTRRVQLHHCSIQNFEPLYKYGMVYFPLNSVHYLETKSGVQSFFKTVYDRALLAGGSFLFAVREVPEPPFGGRVLASTLQTPVVHPITGVSVGRYLVAVEDVPGKSAMVKRTFKISARGEVQQTLRFSTRFPIISKMEYLGMLKNAGFLNSSVWMGYMDYGLSKSDMMCFVARKA